MDKQTHAKFNLNNFLLGLGSALDNYFNSNRYGVKYNSKRVLYTALRIASYVRFEDQYLADLAAYGVLYKFHLTHEDLQQIPFLDLKHFDDTTKEIMELSVLVEENLLIDSNIVVNVDEIVSIIQKENFSSVIKESFNDLSEDMIFWLDLTNTLQLPASIYNFLQDFTRELEYTQLISLSEVIYQLLNNHIDNGIGIKTQKMCEYYSMDNKDSSRMIIATNLYSIGRLFISKDIYQKNGSLDDKERIMVQSIPYFSYVTIASIFGFTDIAKLCSLCGEKIDGSGKPYELDGSSLSLNDRLIAILVIYQALLEPRSYRKAYNHVEAIEILRQDAKNGKLDSVVVEDIDKVFKG